MLCASSTQLCVFPPNQKKHDMMLTLNANRVPPCCNKGKFKEEDRMIWLKECLCVVFFISEAAATSVRK